MDDDRVNNELYGIEAVEEEEIPAVAFTEAPGSAAAVLVLATGAACAGVAVGCSLTAFVVGVEEDGVGSAEAAGATKALPDENRMPPYRPPARVDMVGRETSCLCSELVMVESNLVLQLCQSVAPEYGLERPAFVATAAAASYLATTTTTHAHIYIAKMRSLTASTMPRGLGRNSTTRP